MRLSPPVSQPNAVENGIGRGGSEIPAAVCDGRFQLQRCIGEGIFAQVWLAHDRDTRAAVAVKLEDLRGEALQLEDEVEILQRLADPSLPQGFAALIWSGEEASHICLAMDLLGLSLASYLDSSGGRLESDAVAYVGTHALDRLEYLHSKGLIHKDIKPENFVFGLGQRAHVLYLIDFGLSSEYYGRDGHRRMCTGVSFVGTPRYASLNTLKGFTQSRRDDLEALSYMLLQCLLGSLPWSGLGGNSQKEQLRRILRCKAEVSLEDLCQGLPEGFPELVEKARQLGFEERPAYHSLRRLVRPAGGVGSGPWFQGAGQLAALEPAAAVMQPDDGKAANAPSFWAGFPFSWLGTTCSPASVSKSHEVRLSNSAFDENSQDSESS